MKLLQTLVEAVSTKAQAAADEIINNEMKVASLAKGAAGYLKKNFGDALFDTPMAMIIQHVRSYVDASTSTRLNKDGLEMVTRAVVSQIKPYLGESEEAAGFDLTESKMAELDMDFDELSGAEFKKKYGCTKAEMRKKLKESEDESEDEGEELAEAKVEESVLGVPGQEKSVETVFHLILADDLDAYDVMTRPQGPMQRQAAKIIQRMYDSHTEGTGLHGDDDVEQIMLNVYEDIENRYGEGAGQSPFESVKESDDAVLHKAAQEVVDGKLSVAEAAAKYKLGAGELKGEINLIKDHEYRKSHGMKESEDEDGEELEEATRGRPRKNPPKEEAPAKKRGRPSKKAAEEKPAAKKDEDSEDDEDKKKVSTKALAKSMEKDDDGEEDDDVKKADTASKEKPKKIADTSVKPDELKSANAKLSKQIQHAVDTSSAKSAFELSKELRANFKDITTEQVRQACAIWKSENQ